MEESYPGPASGHSLILLQPERVCSPHLPNSGIKLGEGGEARCGRLEILGLVAGLRLALSLLPLPAGSAH